MLVSRRTVLGGAFAATIAAPAHGGARLSSVRVTRTATLPLMRPDWPVPDEPHQLFFIQRSTNPNTVVYTGRFDENGNLNPRKPARVYWRRYNTTGERMALRPFERRFAFGMRVRPQAVPGEWLVNAVVAPMFPMRLRQVGPFRAEVTTSIGGHSARPTYAFITVDETGFLPRVTEVSLHGNDPITGGAVSEYFRVTGGTFKG